MKTAESTTDQNHKNCPKEVASTAPKALEFVEVSKHFWHDRHRTDVVDSLTLDVGAGEFVSIVGKSGCGKSTILNMAAGILRPSSGRVLFRGRDLISINPDVGYVTQNDNLLRWRTVAKNVALPLELRRLPRDEIRERTNEALSRVELHAFAGHYPHQLSGGMRKRVTLARALVWNPAALLLDEPFASLDAQTRLDLQEKLVTLCNESTISVMLVTHDLMEAVALGDRVVALSRGPARIAGEIRTTPTKGELRSVLFDARYKEAYEQLWEMLADGHE